MRNENSLSKSLDGTVQIASGNEDEANILSSERPNFTGDENERSTLNQKVNNSKMILQSVPNSSAARSNEDTLVRPKTFKSDKIGSTESKESSNRLRSSNT